MEKQKTVPVFFAVDENYLPYLTVSVSSVKENRNKNFLYKIFVLHSGIKDELKKPVLDLKENGFEIDFVDVSEKLKDISENICLRDYYTYSTYYRIFIACMFPEFDKAVYLDSDTITLTDISEFFDTDLGDNLIGGIPDGAVSVIKPFQDYVDNALGIDYKKYFNAGIVLLNLKKFREDGFYERFNELLSKYRFNVAQDQDYLNVLCKDKVKLLPFEWNVMPIKNYEFNNGVKPKILHYNLTAKPWHYDNIQFGEVFWEYAKKTVFNNELLKEKASFTEEKQKTDENIEKTLIQMCIDETNNRKNYYNLYVKNKRK